MKKSLLLLTLLSLTLVGCDQTQTITPSEPTTLVNEGPVEIVASFYPLAFMATEIAGDNANVLNLAGSVDVHSYEPSPQDLVKLNAADLVVFQGAELEPWTEAVIPDLETKGVTTLEVTHHLDLAKMEEHEDHDDHEDEDHEEEHEDEHEDEHDDHEEDGHDDHNHGEFDPHTWLDPVLAQTMIDEILENLISIDPQNEAAYQKNAQALKDRFVALDNDFMASLAQCTNDELIASHDAYGYLARRYGFEVHAITGFSPKDEPSAKILAELKEEAEEGITHILIEENNIRRFADTLARETGLETLPANPLGRGTLDPSKDFFDVMQENLSSIKTALNCQ